MSRAGAASAACRRRVRRSCSRSPGYRSFRSTSAGIEAQPHAMPLVGADRRELGRGQRIGARRVEYIFHAPARCARRRRRGRAGCPAAGAGPGNAGNFSLRRLSVRCLRGIALARNLRQARCEAAFAKDLPRRRVLRRPGSRAAARNTCARRYRAARATSATSTAARRLRAAMPPAAAVAARASAVTPPAAPSGCITTACIQRSIVSSRGCAAKTQAATGLASMEPLRNFAALPTSCCSTENFGTFASHSRSVARPPVFPCTRA